MSADLVPVAWVAREPPLPPVAAAATGHAASTLARRLLDGDDAALARLRAVAGRGLLLVLGDAGALPWVDGVTYLCRDPAAPLLLLSTVPPQTHLSLVERALLAKVEGRPPPIAVLLDPPRLIPAGEARSISRERLAAWLSSEAAGGGP